MKVLTEQRSGVVKGMIYKPASMNFLSAGFIPLPVCSGIKSSVKTEALFCRVGLPAWCLYWLRRFVPGLVSLFFRIGFLVSITIQLSRTKQRTAI